jgi:predicted nucleic acid-binding protein
LNAVVDSSVLVAALIDTGVHGVWAENVLAEGSLHAPELVCAEATNIFRRLVRAKLITTPEANAAQDDLMQLEIELFSFGPFADRIWALRQQPHTTRRNSGRTSFQIKRSRLRVPDSFRLTLRYKVLECAKFIVRLRS